MDYEILSKLFDGPQNIFLSFSFLCFSCFLKKFGVRGKMFKLAIKGFKQQKKENSS